MKINKIFIFILTLLVIVSGVNAAINTENLLTYWTFDNTLVDITENYTLNNNGATYTSSGKINGAYNFDGNNDYMNNFNLPITENIFSLSLWIYWEGATGTTRPSFYASGINNPSLYSNFLYMDESSTDKIFNYWAGSSSSYSKSNIALSSTALSKNVWTHIVITKNGDTMKIYKNGALDNTITGYGTYDTPYNHFYIGNAGNTSGNYNFDGSIDEYGIWNNYILNSTEITALYNLERPSLTTPSALEFTDIKINGDSNFNNTFFNVSPVTLSVNLTGTNNNTNVTIFIYDSLLNLTTNQFITNNMSGDYNISLPYEDIFKFYLYAINNQTNATIGNYTIKSDFTAPNIDLIANISSSAFEVRFNETFNVTDNLSGLLSCTINITELENVTTPDNFLINCTDTQVFTTAGLHNAYVLATDIAGNQNTYSYNFTISPFVYINFFDANSTPISNYDYRIFHPDGRITAVTNTSNPINISPVDTEDGSLDLGLHTIEFAKFGYETTNVTITINESSGEEEYNFSVPGARILVNVYNIDDFTLISGSNTTIEIIGDSFSNTYTTSTGQLNITSLEMREETFIVIVSNPNYETSTIYFNFNNQEVISVDAYLTPLTLNDTLIADLIIRVVDEYQSPIRSINVIQYVWDSGQGRYVQSNLKATDYNGETSFKVFLNTKLYNFCAEYLGVQYCENDLSININTQEVVIEVPINKIGAAEENNIYDVDFSYSLTNTTMVVGGTNYTSVTFSYSNPNQDVDQYCLKIYEIVNLQRTLVANQCSTSHSAGISINILQNTSKNYVAVATIQVDNSIRTLYPELYLYATYDIQDELDAYGFVKIILLALVAFLIGLALHKKVHNILLAHIGLPILFFAFTFIFPKYISFESFVLVLLVNIFVLTIVTKKDDLQKDKGFTTLNSILALYMIFIFSLYTALTEIDNKGLLDDYGQTILTNINSENSYFNSYVDTTTANLKVKRADGNLGAWELLTGIFLKTLEFVDTFFSIMSNLFSIATNVGLIIGIKNALLLKFIKILDYSIVAFVLYLYFKEAFK